MESIRFTDHAAVRMQQRGIPGWYLQLLGEAWQGDARRPRRRAQERLQVHPPTPSYVLSRHDYARAERYFGVYAVVAPGQAVVTAAHRTSRRFH